MSAFVHIPVLAREVIERLAPRPGGVYCDGTLGGGGHTRLILERSAPDGRVIGVDRDLDALAAARRHLEDVSDRLTLVHDTFGNVDAVLDRLGVATIDGVLLDIGPSSHQFDTADRGFSFSREGPLDMRMDASAGETAASLIGRTGAKELAAILRNYGEERFSNRIAERMKEASRASRLHTTTELAALVEAAIPAAVRRQMKIHPATRTFQALRIAVNGELDELASFLAAFPDRLAPGGRCAIISFHSLEDRLVKRRFRELAWSSSLPPALARAAGERVTPICAAVTRKAVFPGEAEVAANPRARSARLRVCEKVAA